MDRLINSISLLIPFYLLEKEGRGGGREGEEEENIFLLSMCIALNNIYFY